MFAAIDHPVHTASNKFQFTADVDEFVPPGSLALNPDAKEFKLSLPAKQIRPTLQSINFDSYSSDEESPQNQVRRLPRDLQAPIISMKAKGLNLKAEEFIPHMHEPNKPPESFRVPPGLEKSLGLSAHAKEFVPPAATSEPYCVVNLDDYTDDESEEFIDINEWRGLCQRLATPYIWSDDKEEILDEAALSDSEVETAEPSLHDSETETCSGCESP